VCLSRSLVKLSLLLPGFVLRQRLAVALEFVREPLASKVQNLANRAFLHTQPTRAIRLTLLAPNTVGVLALECRIEIGDLGRANHNAAGVLCEQAYAQQIQNVKHWL
jgi:hypothetical protein